MQKNYYTKWKTYIIYVPLPDNNQEYINFMSTYTICNPPIRTRRQTLAQKIKRHIYPRESIQKGILYDLPENPDDWIQPQPYYSQSRP